MTEKAPVTPEEIENPDEEEGAALREKLGTHSVPHVQRQHPGGQCAAE
jgi:hypothetical protein